MKAESRYVTTRTRMRAEQVTVADFPHGTIKGKRPALIAPGLYELAFVGHHTATMFGGRVGKLVLSFRVMDQGPHFGTMLARYFNCEVTGKSRQGGGFSTSWSSDLVRELGRVGVLPKRCDRISLRSLQQIIVCGRVATVERDYKQRPLAPELRYSVVAELLKAAGP